MQEKNQDPQIIKYLELSIEVRGKFSDKIKEEISELIQFIVSLMGTLGIIAGFGFTAFSYIKSSYIFFIGEILVVAAVIYLAYTAKNTLLYNATDTEKYINHWVKKATEIRKALVQNDRLKIQELEDELSGMLQNIEEDPKFVGASVVKEYLNNALVVSSTGTFLIIISFIIHF